MPTLDTDVLVVGAGPAGLTAAALLAGYGTDAITISKYPGPANSPRAHYTNQRAMEVFRDLGIEDQVRDVAVPGELMASTVWATSFAGRELARLMSWGTGVARKSDYEAASPCAVCNIPQHILEPVLLEAGRNRGADIRFSAELTGIEQTPEAVHALVRDRGTGTEYTIRARYAIGADGARSTVAGQAGFGFDGEAGLAHRATVWLEADLTRYAAHRPGILYFICQPGDYSPAGYSVFVCVRPWTEWAMLLSYDPAEGESVLSVPAVTARAASLIGDDTVGIRVKSVSRWQVNHMLARDYRRGRIFLAGDAAHRHPPGNGLGSNTAVQDAYNLAWKLAHVLRGQAGDALLDSYHAERRPVGKQVVDRALNSTMNQPTLPRMLGFRPGQSADDGWRSVGELFADSEAGRRRRDALQAAVDRQHYQFNAHGVELGQRYQSAAIVADGTPFPDYDRDPELYYQPTAHPGARLPHAWLEHRGQRVSTLDLAGRGRFTVLAGIGGRTWLDAAAKVAAELGVGIAGRQAGRGCDYDDVLGEWTRARETGDHGCLIVRPDHHIAWRSDDLPADPADVLRQVFTQILAR